MGLSFVVAAETHEILVDAEWGQYLRVKSALQTNKDGTPANGLEASADHRARDNPDA
jgi:hypothetical protein